MKRNEARFDLESARASPQCFEKRKVRDGEGVIGPSRTGGSTRGRVRYPESHTIYHNVNTSNMKMKTIILIDVLTL